MMLELSCHSFSVSLLVNNYLNFSVENFDIEENGSLRHIIEAENEQYFVEDENPTDGELL